MMPYKDNTNELNQQQIKVDLRLTTCLDSSVDKNDCSKSSQERWQIGSQSIHMMVSGSLLIMY